MERILKNLLFFFVIIAVPLSAAGQDKKDESKSKIKIIIDDGSGSKTVIDTFFTGDKIPETITTADGKVIYIDAPETGDKTRHMSVFVTTDKDGKDKTSHEKVIIIGDKGGTWTASSSSGGIYHITEGDREIISDSDKTKYVIAKDGVVVTVESENEAKAREIIDDVRAKLGAEEKE
jgi:hypothetical protein